MADYALPVAVLSFSFIGSFVFNKVSLEQFDASEVKILVTFPSDKILQSKSTSMQIVLPHKMLVVLTLREMRFAAVNGS